LRPLAGFARKKRAVRRVFFIVLLLLGALAETRFALETVGLLSSIEKDREKKRRFRPRLSPHKRQKRVQRFGQAFEESASVFT